VVSTENFFLAAILLTAEEDDFVRELWACWWCVFMSNCMCWWRMFTQNCR